MRIEGHADIFRFLLAENLMQGIAKAQNGRCIQTLGVDSWILDEGVICPIESRHRHR